jgi:hypothetical protein
MMSEKEVAIAKAALRDYAAADYVELFAEIAEFTGYPPAEVQEILHELTVDHTLSETYVPMLNPTPQIEGPAKFVQTWYTKGKMWGQPRMTLHQ